MNRGSIPGKTEQGNTGKRSNLYSQIKKLEAAAAETAMAETDRQAGRQTDRQTDTKHKTTGRRMASTHRPLGIACKRPKPKEEPGLGLVLLLVFVNDTMPEVLFWGDN